jgi:pSer/pThr/pTyr-binding forkhead associated (FHA) protein/tetratricopeptide (TPR) repeat protein
MPGKVRFVSLLEPDVSYETESEAFCIGRSPECEMRINDPHLSRRQAEARLTPKGLEITNLGRNPIRIKGQACTSIVLANQDVVGLGSAEYVVHLEGVSDHVLNAKTVILKGQASAEVGPRLVGTDSGGGEILFRLAGDRINVGRGEDADLRIDDPEVSRRHFVIERLNKGYFLHRASATNPVHVNGMPVSRSKLHHGDTLSLGRTTLTFLSSRPEDALKHQVPGQDRWHIPYWKQGVSLAGVVAVLLALYFGLYDPLRESERIERAVALLHEGKPEQAYAALEHVLALKLSQDNEAAAKIHLANAALEVARVKGEESLAAAESFLLEYLQKYGADLSSESLRDALDNVRIAQGGRLERQGEYRSAIATYASVREQGPRYDEAQGHIGRVWRMSQEEEMEELKQSLKIDKLLNDAQAHLQAKRFMTPPENNAYTALKAVLAIDPDNEQAFLGIRQIKEFYNDNADSHFEAGNCDIAIFYYKRLLLIDPHNKNAQQRTAACSGKFREAASASGR